MSRRNWDMGLDSVRAIDGGIVAERERRVKYRILIGTLESNALELQR